MHITTSISPVEIRTERLMVRQATSDREIEEALRLRFEVLNVELNEGLQTSWENGQDTDRYDPLCDHMIVVDSLSDRIVGTYRLLPGARVEGGIGYYSETEFEMSAFHALRGNKLELGRACVHRDFRGSSVLNLMWAAIAQYVEVYDIHYLFGCGSIHSINPKTISAIHAYLKRFMTDETLRVSPLKRIPGFQHVDCYDKQEIAGSIPPLLLAYLRLGAQIAGEPALDEQFGVADFLVILDRTKLVERFNKRYFS